MTAEPFDYRDAAYPIRSALPEAYRTTWASLARPGDWWTGAERVAIAEEVRRARTCALCRERKAALSPFSVEGEHDHAGSALPAAAVDAVHRLVTDPARLTRAWVERLAAGGVPDTHYVELLGIVVAVTSIDAFHRALGLPVEALPAPQSGSPRAYRPSSALPGEAWVPMIPAAGVGGDEADLWQRNRSGNVVRALSLVPDAVRSMKTLSAAQYVPMELVADPSSNAGRALDRKQIELIAGRVSALNECFY